MENISICWYSYCSQWVEWLIVDFLYCFSFELVYHSRSRIHMESTQNTRYWEMGLNDEKPPIMGEPSQENSTSRDGSFRGTWLEENRWFISFLISAFSHSTATIFSQLTSTGCFFMTLGMGRPLSCYMSCFLFYLVFMFDARELVVT